MLQTNRMLKILIKEKKRKENKSILKIHKTASFRHFRLNLRNVLDFVVSPVKDVKHVQKNEFKNGCINV